MQSCNFIESNYYVCNFCPFKGDNPAENCQDIDIYAFTQTELS